MKQLDTRSRYPTLPEGGISRFPFPVEAKRIIKKWVLRLPGVSRSPGTFLYVLFLLFLLSSHSGLAQCISGDCLTGRGVKLYDGGERYAGQFWQGRRHGEGICYYRNGSRYQGQWSNDQPHGEGVRFFPDGTRLAGSWEGGKLMRRAERALPEEEYAARGGGGAGCISGNCADGQGIYIYPSGAVYIGDFRGGEINGLGVCYFSDGSKYQGEWRHRYPEGRGTKTYADGSQRTGYWKKGQPVDAFGNLVPEVVNGPEAANDGTEIQTGCVSGDCLNGQGVFAYADGSRYEGQFYHGKPEGWGTFVAVDGEKYTGSFQGGVRHGRGRLETSAGLVRTGEWRQGEYVGQPPAALTMGCISGDCGSGFGTYVFKDGARYVGAFRQGRPEGRGTVYYTNGERYEGDMAGGAFDGEGVLYLLDGSTVSGRWKNGTFLGPANAFASSSTIPGADPFRTRPANADRPSAPPPASAAPAVQPAQTVRVWAVIIGVASYNHMPVLRYTDDDAYRIYAFLKSPEGGALDDSRIRILIDEDATKKNINDAMEQTFGRAGPNDLVLLYFSGHGLKGSFLPFDFDGYNNKLLHDEINETLRRSPARYKLCIADACHSGSLLAMRGDAEQPTTLLTYYESLAKAQPGTALIMSSKSDETSLESSGLRQGVFSHFLIRGLKGEADADGDRIVSVQELFSFVQSNVRTYTGNRQSPVIQGDYDRRMTVAVKR